MSTKTKYENTLKQTMAAELLKIGDVANALGYLISDKNSGRPVPQFLWKRAEDCAVKHGDPTSLEIARRYYTDSEVPRNKWLMCARAALKKNLAWAAAQAYQKAQLQHLPIKKVLTAAKNEVEAGTQAINYYFDICEKLGTKPCSDLLEKQMVVAKINYYTNSYTLICEALGEPLDMEFIKQCYQYYLEKLDLRSIDYAAELLKIKISKKQYLALGKKAIQLGKESDGREFFDRVYL